MLKMQFIFTWLYVNVEGARIQKVRVEIFGCIHLWVFVFEADLQFFFFFVGLCSGSKLSGTEVTTSMEYHTLALTTFLKFPK